MRHVMLLTVLAAMLGCSSPATFNPAAAKLECTIIDKCGGDFGSLAGSLDECVKEHEDIWDYYADHCDYEPDLGTQYLDISQEIYDSCERRELPDDVYTNCAYGY